MIKYSLVATVALAAVLFSVGCDDSECCGIGNPPVAVISNGSAGEKLTSSNTQTNPLVVSSFTLSALNSTDSDDVGSSTNGIKSHSWTIDGVAANDGDTVPADGKAHKVELTVVDDEGKSSTTSGWVKINSSDPVARITLLPTTCTAGDTLNVSGSTSSDDGTIVSYTWEPSTIGSSSSVDGTIVCPAAGSSQEVCLTVTDDNGNTNRVCQTVTADAVEATNCKITATQGDTTIDGVESPATANSAPLVGTYTFEFEGCPTAQNCHWDTIWSRDTKGTSDTSDDSFKKCVTGGVIVDGDGSNGNDQNADGTVKHITGFSSTSATLSLSVCDSGWDEIKMVVKCDDGKSVTNYFDLDTTEDSASDW